MAVFGTELKGKEIVLFTKDRDYKFSGLCVYESDLSITIIDSYDGRTKVFANDNIKTLIVSNANTTGGI